MTNRIGESLVGAPGGFASLIAAKLVLAGIPAIAFGLDHEDLRYSDEELRAALIEAAMRTLAPRPRNG
jgi:hypothetical protein